MQDDNVVNKTNTMIEHIIKEKLSVRITNTFALYPENTKILIDFNKPSDYQVQQYEIIFEEIRPFITIYINGEPMIVNYFTNSKPILLIELIDYILSNVTNDRGVLKGVKTKYILKHI